MAEVEQKEVNVAVPHVNYVTQTSDKSRTVALICCLLGGWFGVHLFYVGRIVKGLVYMFTGGLFGVGWLIDTIQIACGGFTDSGRAPLRKW